MKLRKNLRQLALKTTCLMLLINSGNVACMETMMDDNASVNMQEPTPEKTMVESPQESTQQSEVSDQMTTPADQTAQPMAEPQEGLNQILEAEQPQAMYQPETTSEQEVTPPATTPQEQKHEEKDIYLNFNDTELSNFINYIAEIKKLNLIPDKTVEGNKISLTMREPLSVDGAWNIFLTIIDIAGFSIIQVGDVHKIIPKDQKVKQPLPSYINVSADALPDNDENIRYVMFLSNLKTAESQELLESMLSAQKSVVPVQDLNAFIITDKSLNIKSALKVFRELDEIGTAETVSVIRLKNADAKDVKELLDTMIKQPEVSNLARLLGKATESSTQFFPQGTRIIAEERTNALILMGAPKPIKKIEEFIVNHIDTELQGAKSPLHVYELQHTDANQIKEILEAVTQQGSSDAATKYGAIRGGVKQFKAMKFDIDKDGNRLIVSSTDKVDWRLVKQTIKDLDKPQPQVAIETLMVAVTVDDRKQIGGNMRIKKPNTLGQNIGFQSAVTSQDGPSLDADGTSLLGDMITQLTTQKGLSVLTFGKSSPNIWAVFSMLKEEKNASIISQPFITVGNKVKASVVVGSTKRVIAQESGSLKGFRDASDGTTIHITPQINIDGVIRMELETTIKEFTDTEGNNTSDRSIKTNVSIADGQVLVLGGFVKTKVSENKYKTPLLGDLPLVGWFFKNQTRTVAKEYLFIFLCPTIIKPRQSAGIGTYTKMKLHNITDSIEQAIQTKRTPDPIHNWVFNPERENYSHKVIDFANARYQPTTVNIQDDPYYRTATKTQDTTEEKETAEDLARDRAQQGAPLLQKTPPPPLETPSVETALAQENQAPTHMATLQKTHTKAQITTQPTPPSSSDAIMTSPVSIQATDPQRTQFKNLISTDETNQEPTLTVDMQKRNKLKDFLSNNPALAYNKQHFNQKGRA